MKNKIIFALAILLLVPIASAISIDLSLPATIVQGETNSASFSIQSDSPFNGFVDLSYSNIHSTVTSITILNTSFDGLGPYSYDFEWNVEGLNQGGYVISADVKNDASLTLATNQIQGVVDSSAPIIVTKSPVDFVTTTSTILEITTNEDASCSYGTSNTSSENPPYTFEITGETVHKQPLRSLVQNTYTYYVKCHDSVGNAMSSSEIVEFIVDLPATAEITLSEESPLKEGVIEVKVETSEDLDIIPVLQYSFDSDPDSKRPISLTGSDSTWKGYMIINEDYDNLVGTFHFSGIDAIGTSGTIITSGNSFIVDTTKPPAVLSFEAISKKYGSIELEWYYEGEEVDFFKIYRSTSSDVDYVDFYSQVNGSNRFTDSSTEHQVTYHYKINAVDMAGNAGPLSEEIYATALNEGTPKKTETKVESKEEEAPKVLPPNLVIKVNDVLKKVEKLLIDVEQISSDLNGEEDKELISDLELLDRIKTTKTKLNDLKGQLENLKLSYRTEDELDSKLDSVDLEIRKIEQTTPKDIELIAKSDLVQTLSQENVDLAIEKLYVNYDFSQIDQNKYRKQNKNAQKNIDVSVTVYIVEIEFIDGSKKDQTLITKSISHKYTDPLEDIILFEIIPKELANHVDDINFLTKNFDVIEHDPIVKYGFAQLKSNGTKIKYSIGTKSTLDNARKAATVVLLGPAQFEKSANKVTGFSIASITSSALGISGTQIIFIVIGLFIISALLVYQFVIARKDNIAQTDFFDNIKRTGTNIRNKLLPKKEEDEFSVRLKTEYEVITELISWSYRHLDKNEINEVRLLYPKIQLLYRNLSKDDKSKVLKK